MLPLEGITVIAVEQAVAAPFCSSRLADAGAHVIKVERPEGDFARGYDAAARGQSSYFVWLNRGKDSQVIDLSTQQGRGQLEKLIAGADVLLQNLKPGSMDRLGFSLQRLRKDYPSLICCTISGYGDEGPDVADLQTMLPRFEGEVDGDFGSITEAAVLDYQRSRGLDVDGLVGQQTWTALYAHKAPLPPPPPPPHMLSKKDQVAIEKIASNSEAAGYYWEDRGEAPAGYTSGMALAFAQTYRKLLAGHPAAIEMAKARRDSDYDALNVYREEFEDLNIPIDRDGPDVLRGLYALMLGHGMRESSGKHCCGRDQSADNVESTTCEAGLMQTSYNAHSFSDPEFSELMAEYGDPSNQGTCYLSAFEEEVSCSASDWESYGSGVGYQFQELCKHCPAFAVETCGLTLRARCDHYGPIIRGETELTAAAEDLFKQVQDYVDRHVEVA